jgi:RHS repeat-associated protein
LPDGTVLLLGGRDEHGRPIDVAERVNVETGALEILPVKWRTRQAHTATLLDDHRILIAGGVDGERSVGDVEILDLRDLRVTRLNGLDVRRSSHTAELLADGRVSLWGGTNDDRPLDGSGVIVDANAATASETFVAESDPATLYVAASNPEDGATDVPLSQTLTVRFSRRVRMESTLPQRVTLTGPSGDVRVATTVAEGGRLLFAAPEAPLEPGSRYLLTLADLQGSNEPLGAATFSIGFTTASAGDSPESRESGEDWSPFERGELREWRTNRPESPWRRLPPLKARAGVTAVAGQVLRLNGAPLARVRLEIGGHTATTDNTGRFVLPLPRGVAGWRELWIDGRTANRPGSTYGTFETAVSVAAGRTTVLPFTIWMPKIDTRHQVVIPSPTDREIVVTTPAIPGLELRLPPRTVIRDRDGQVVREISITPIPLDRTPFPLPGGVDVPVYFTIQPGGATVHVYGAGSGYAAGARLIYPNYQHRSAGTPMEFWHYDPAGGRGWYVYGQGLVSPDGRHVVPNSDVSIKKFTGAMVGPPSLAAFLGPLFGNPWDGDPVDLGTGLFILNKTDLVVSGPSPLEVRRTYRQNDSRSRSFGIGASHLYDLFLVGDISPWTYIEVIVADGARLHFDRISPGTGFADAVYEHTSTPTPFFKSRIAWNGNGWDLTMKDGTRITFREGFLASRPTESAATRIQDRYGNAIVLTRESDGDLIRISSTLSPGRWIDLTYDASHRVTQARDHIGRTVQYTYDASGRLWTVTDAAGGITAYTYDAGHRMLTITDPRGIVYLTNAYDTAGRVTTQTQADTSTYQFAYTVNGSGEITQTDVTNPRGYVRRVTFDAAGYAQSDTRAVGQPEQQTTAYERQAGTNLLLAVVDALTRRTAFTYDAFANLTSATRLAGTPEPVTTTVAYEPAFHQVATVTDALNRTTTFGYDAGGSLTSVRDPLDHETVLTNNAAGQPISITDPLNQTTTLGYEEGDLVRVTDPLGRTTVRYLDTAGRIVALTDPLGQAVRYEYSALNQVTKIVDALGGETALSYDGNGNLLSLTDARGNPTTYTYDVMDRPASRTDPLQRTETYLYDANGNLREVTDRKNQTTTFTSDPLDRLTLKTYADASTTAYTRDAGDRVTQIADSAAGVIAYTHDLFDRPVSVTAPEGIVSYTYDAVGRRSTMNVSGQQQTAYAYDDADRLTGITQGTSLVSFGYDAADRRTSLTLPNGIVTEYQYDAASQLTSLTYRAGSTVLGDLTYWYDAAGRRTSVGGTWARTLLPAPLASASYDAANQITTWGGVGFTYDANGNLATDGSKTYTWNARNLLEGIAGPINATFDYDGLGRRRRKTLGGLTTEFVHDGFKPVQELAEGVPSANLLKHFGTDEYLTRTATSGSRQFLLDGRGTTVALTDAIALIAAEYTYEPSGRLSVTGSPDGNNIASAGWEVDDTGLYYLTPRYLDPRLHRFVEEDPFREGNDPSNPTLYEMQYPSQDGPPPGRPPDGTPGVPNEWVPKGQSGDRPAFGPRDRVPHPNGSQPRASWDREFNHWDFDDGWGNRTRVNPDGTPAPPHPGQKPPQKQRRLPPWRWPGLRFPGSPPSFTIPFVNPCLLNPQLPGCFPRVPGRKVWTSARPIGSEHFPKRVDSRRLRDNPQSSWG